MSADIIITNKEILEHISKPTTPEECEKLDIFGRLERALESSKISGVGLSAIQIGVPIQAAIIRADEYTLSFMNPEVHGVKEPMLFKGEGCLSVPNHYVTTRRYKYIEVSFTLPDGTRERRTLGNLPAIVFQHELDHMAGKLFLCHEHKCEPIRADLKIGRNEICPCGSGKKFKKCCGGI